MGVGRIFSRGGLAMDFSRSIHGFFQGAKTGEISICSLETKKITFFSKRLSGKYQISKFLLPTPKLCAYWKFWLIVLN